ETRKRFDMMRAKLDKQVSDASMKMEQIRIEKEASDRDYYLARQPLLQLQQTVSKEIGQLKHYIGEREVIEKRLSELKRRNTLDELQAQRSQNQKLHAEVQNFQNQLSAQKANIDNLRNFRTSLEDKHFKASEELQSASDQLRKICS